MGRSVEILGDIEATFPELQAELRALAEPSSASKVALRSELAYLRGWHARLAYAASEPSQGELCELIASVIEFEMKLGAALHPLPPSSL